MKSLIASVDSLCHEVQKLYCMVNTLRTRMEKGFQATCAAFRQTKVVCNHLNESLEDVGETIGSPPTPLNVDEILDAQRR